MADLDVASVAVVEKDAQRAGELVVDRVQVGYAVVVAVVAVVAVVYELEVDGDCYGGGGDYDYGDADCAADRNWSKVSCKSYIIF